MADEDRLGQYYQRMRSLGELRCKVILCTASDMPICGHYFDPPAESDLAAALYAHLLQLWENLQPDSEENQFNGMAVVAAGILTFGELDRVDYILNNVPPHHIILDHGCGYCNLLAFRIVARLLPLPQSLLNYSLWIQGSLEVEQVKQWLYEYRSRLVWNLDSNQFILVRNVA